MVLTEDQKAEIRDYIETVPKYIETYNELYDHILNSFEDRKVNFSLKEVSNILDKDFGGFSQVVEQEKVYHREVGKKYNKNFRIQFLDTLKWFGIFPLAFCLVIYFSSQSTAFNIKPMLLATLILFMGTAIFGYTKIVINRFRYTKYSVLDSYLASQCSLGLAVLVLILNVFLNENVFSLGENGRLIVMLSLYFFCSIYIRTFIKIYRQHIKIFPQ
ncbi:MAG: hypothetical protein ACQUHE_11765 [Bacteroidia bacterium]